MRTLAGWLFDCGREGPARDAGLLVLRLGFFAVLAATHGVANARGLAGNPSDFPDPLGLGPAVSLTLVTAAELCGGALVAVGWFSRAAAGVIAVNFAVAFFVFHAGDPFGRAELAFHYMVASTALVLTGPGRWSIDGWR